MHARSSTSLPSALRCAAAACLALVGCATQPALRTEWSEGASTSALRAVDAEPRNSSPNPAVDAPLLAAAAFAPFAEAGTFAPAWCFGAGIGIACVDSSTGDDPNFKVDEMDTSFDIMAGYWFLPWLSVEVAYTDLGEEKFDSKAGAPITSHGTVETQGFDLSAVGHFPIYNILQGMVRVGAFRWDETEKEDGLPNQDDDGVDLIWGAGVQANVYSRLVTRIEWNRLEKDDTIDNLVLSFIWMI